LKISEFDNEMLGEFSTELRNKKGHVLALFFLLCFKNLNHMLLVCAQTKTHKKV